jgi:hypothetical protein
LRQATQAIAIGMRSSCCTATWLRTSSATGPPLSRSSEPTANRANDHGCRSSAMASMAGADRPDARSEPTSAPTDAPTIRSGASPISYSARSTPTCVKPRGPPELSTQATRGARASGISRGASPPV